MKLTIDNDKIGYIRLPNGVILQTVAGVINTVYTGVAGGITYYVPKDSASAILNGGYTAGSITTDFVGALSFGGNSFLTSISAVKASSTIIVNDCSLLTNLIAPKAITINASNCALTAKSIGDILYAAYVDNREDVNFNFSGGDNAIESAVISYLATTYNLSYSGDIYAVLVIANGGTILIDTI